MIKCICCTASKKDSIIFITWVFLGNDICVCLYLFILYYFISLHISSASQESSHRGNTAEKWTNPLRKPPQFNINITTMSKITTYINLILILNYYLLYIIIKLNEKAAAHKVFFIKNIK